MSRFWLKRFQCGKHRIAVIARDECGVFVGKHGREQSTIFGFAVMKCAPKIISLPSAQALVHVGCEVAAVNAAKGRFESAPTCTHGLTSFGMAGQAIAQIQQRLPLANLSG